MFLERANHGKRLRDNRFLGGVERPAEGDPGPLKRLPLRLLLLLLLEVSPSAEGVGEPWGLLSSLADSLPDSQPELSSPVAEREPGADVVKDSLSDHEPDLLGLLLLV